MIRKVTIDSKKETDGWVAKKINAKVSIPISNFLIRFPIHPNWITFMNLPIALLAPWFFAKQGYSSSVLAGLLFQFGSIFDGCDGEIARTKSQVTKLGGWLDTAMDNLAYVLFFFAVGVWQSHHRGNPRYFQAMAVGVIFLIAALAVTYAGMRRLGTQTHHAYRQAFHDLSRSNPFLRGLSRLGFLSKRENFALGIMFLCLLNLRGSIYWLLLGGVFLYAVVVLGTFPSLYRRMKRGNDA